MRFPVAALAVFVALAVSAGAVNICIPSCAALHQKIPTPEAAAASAAAAPVAVQGTAEWYWPILSPDFSKISALFGETIQIEGRTIIHPGIDIASEVGSPIGSLAHGTVERAISDENVNKDCGKYVQVLYPIAGGAHYEARFCHLSSLAVKKGEVVEPCQKIGEVGVTGLTSGPHLHLTILQNGATVDPLPVLQKFASSNGQARFCPQAYASAEEARQALGSKPA